MPVTPLLRGFCSAGACPERDLTWERFTALPNSLLEGALSPSAAVPLSVPNFPFQPLTFQFPPSLISCFNSCSKLCLSREAPIWYRSCHSLPMPRLLSSSNSFPFSHLFLLENTASVSSPPGNRDAGPAAAGDAAFPPLIPLAGSLSWTLGRNFMELL